MTEAKITGTEARVVIEWELDVKFEPGSVPDRPAPYSRSGQQYRPDSMHLEFRVTADGTELTEVCPEADGIRVSHADIRGLRLRAGGAPGAQEITEKFFGDHRDAPDWALAIMDERLQALKDNAGL